MTTTVTTVVTKRKRLRNKVNPKPLMWKVTVSPTTNKSFKKKNPSEPCHHCQNWNVFASAMVKFPSYFWHDNYSICPVCGHEIPVDAKHVKESFARCYDWGALKHGNIKTSKVSLYSPSEKTVQDCM